MNALFISADSDGVETNTSRYRIYTPAKYLQQAGHDIQLQSNVGWQHPVNDKYVAVDRGIDFTQIPEVVLIERNVQPDWVDKLRLAGAKRIIITLDDNYSIIPNKAASKPWWDKYYPSLLKAMKISDMVIVPSMSLLEFYKPYCKNIQYVQNFVDDDLWVDLPAKEDNKVIGWGGSAEHLESWNQDGLGKALNKILKERSDWGLFLCSSAAPIIANYLPRGMKFIWSNWVKHTEWPKMMSGFTIGIAPLQGQYDRYRSNLKLVEYTLGSVPWVATSLDPYMRSEVRGGILTKNSNWYSSLSRLIEDRDLRDSLVKDGIEWGNGYKMSRNVNVYERILWPDIGYELL